MLIKDIKPKEFNSYYERYIKNQTQEITLVEAFNKGEDEVVNFFSKLPEDKLLFRYAEDKWSVKEILQHLIDTERIFIHRCFRIARHDETPLPGYDQDHYNSPSQADHKSLANLLKEFRVTRQFSISILESLSPTDLEAIGTASDYPLSSRAAAGIINGHNNWHINIIRERYL